MSDPPTHNTSRHRILEFDTLSSTNAEAMRLALTGEQGPLWIAAKRQTAGRGRSGRAWASADGNLFASLLLTLTTPAPKAYQLSLVAGVAANDAIRETMRPAPRDLRLKWPNDLYIGRAKAGGILVESTTKASGIAAVVGIGINLVSVPDGLDREVASLEALGLKAPTPSALLHALAASFEAWFAIWQEGAGFPALREAWLERAHPIGDRMSIETGTGKVHGAFAGLDPEGALLLKDETGRLASFTFGDVTLTR